jgi:hypothetical protein
VVVPSSLSAGNHETRDNHRVSDSAITPIDLLTNSQTAPLWWRRPLHLPYELRPEHPDHDASERREQRRADARSASAPPASASASWLSRYSLAAELRVIVRQYFAARNTQRIRDALHLRERRYKPAVFDLGNVTEIHARRDVKSDLCQAALFTDGFEARAEEEKLMSLLHLCICRG